MGAAIDTNLAKKLQIPIAVEQKSVGNISTLPIYTRLKVPHTPNFAIIMKKGNNPVIDPRHNIIIPPDTVIIA
jgi:hypothetical protein